MSKIEKVLATGKTHTTLSSAGNTSRGHNGNLDIELSSPGNAETGTRVRRHCSRTQQPSSCSPGHGRPATSPRSGSRPNR